LIDLHFHCLPDIDDGPATWQEAVDLCREAAAGGVTSLVATPHVLRGEWINEDPGVRDQLILKLNTMLGGRPSVLAGCEYFFSADAVELWEKGKAGPLTGLNRTGYLLLEFPPGPISPGSAGIFHELALLDVTPVIAHPERHRVFAREPAVLEELVRRGAVVQITAGSLLGDFGDGPLDACREFLRRGLVRVVASDAHSLAHRPPRLPAARELVAKTWGPEVEQGLFEANPRAIVAGAALPWEGSPRILRQSRAR
jgi:protein-tyrosine phosphatase